MKSRRSSELIILEENKTESFIDKNKKEMNIYQSSNKGGWFSFFSNCRGVSQQAMIPSEEKEPENKTQDWSGRDSKDLDEASKGSIISQYESGSFISKEFFDDTRDNLSTDYEPNPRKKKQRRRRPQI